MEQHTPIELPQVPIPPEDWECCGSECGDACIFEIYRQEKAEYDAALKRFQELKKLEEVK